MTTWNASKWTLIVVLLAGSIYLTVGCQEQRLNVQGSKGQGLRGFTAELAETYEGDWIVGHPGSVLICLTDSEAETLRKMGDYRAKPCSHIFIIYTGDILDNTFTVSDYPDKRANRKYVAHINESGDMETTDGLKLPLEDKKAAAPILVWMGDEYTKQK